MRNHIEPKLNKSRQNQFNGRWMQVHQTRQTELTYEVKLRRRTVNALALEDDERRDYLR